MTPNRRRHLLERLQRPDYPQLPKLVVDDLNYQNSGGFGCFGIHGQLLLAQLDECLKLKPDLLNQQNFVNVYLTKLRPNADVDWRHDPAEHRAYLERLWSFVQNVKTLIVKVYEINAANFYRQNQTDVNTDRKLPKATVWFGGREYTPNDKGDVVVPFTNTPQRQAIVLQHGDFCSLDYFQHQAEEYSLAAGVYVNQRDNQRIRIRIAAGQQRDGYVLAKNRQLEVRGDRPLQIAAVEAAEDAVLIRLQNPSKFARVHVFATRYYPAYAAYRPMPLTLGPLGAFLFAERRKPPGFPTVIPDGSHRAATK
ncbi:MAG: hypothetical protein NTY19_29855 [Planctomycetota bacterium]|nr:hypothetical protein [Planctomycetota bacterium]